MNGPWIPLAALVISLATLIFTALSLRHKANGDQIDTIEHRLARIESELQECLRERTRLERENVDLLRRIIKAD